MTITDKQRKKIESTVRKYWTSAGHFWVDDQGLVHLTGLLNPKPKVEFPDGRLPVKFGHVKGDLNLKNMGLTTLEGAPETVTGWFFLEGNLLTTLEHAPQQVGVLSLNFMPKLQTLHGCPQVRLTLQMSRAPNLVSLEGLPTEPHSINEIILPYKPDLPLLRCLVAKKISLKSVEGGGYSHLTEVQPITSILNDPAWVGKGKAGALNCSLALKKAGYEGNAKW